MLELDVDMSTVPGAGRGLFSLVDRPIGSRLVEYLGEVLSGDENNRRYPKDTVGLFEGLRLRVFGFCPFSWRGFCR
jgi:hypothetical protein